MQHNLKRAWRAYKSEHELASLARHDATISSLNKMEDIRYPDPDLGSIGISLEWFGPVGRVTTYGGFRTPKQFGVPVSHIDALVADIMRTSGWNAPIYMRGSAANPVAAEAINRNNTESTFLTGAP